VISGSFDRNPADARHRHRFFPLRLETEPRGYLFWFKCFVAAECGEASWRRTMYHLSDQARMNFHGRSLPTRSGTLLMVLAYGALAIIAGVVFGTLSVHPF
jgi:hypothetical protein